MNLFAWYWSFCVVIGVLYTALIVWFLNGWKNIPEFKNTKLKFDTKVSVIVPFYNEEKSLTKCIEGLIKQRIQTTEYEIVLVDDQSDDQSTEIAKKYAAKYTRIQYYRTDKKGKKQAILLGVDKAVGDLIVSTDADCSYTENWLATMVAYYELNDPNIMVGPVALKAESKPLQRFQQIEFSSLVATAAGAVGIGHAIMCNGANLAFSKKAFESIEDPLNLSYASGDDVFLLHSMKTIDNDKIHFLKSKDAIVYTPCVKGLKAFFKQRFRWTSKAPGYKDNDTKFTAFVVFTSSALWVIGTILMGYNIDFWKPAVFIFSLKTIVDVIFLKNVSTFFKTEKLLKWLPVFQLFYGFYVMISGLSLLWGKRK